MIDQILEWIHTIGPPGLFIVMFLEGSSLPFPGVIMVLSFGYLFSPGYLETAFVAVGMSLSYCIASLIPYYLGMKLEDYIPNKFKNGLQKGQDFFNKYGVWSVALSRPFGIGNYISYVAGISRVSFFKYFTLTFIGIYPWSYVMILLGNYFNGSIDAVKDFFDSYKNYGYLSVAFIIFLIGILYFIKLRKNKNKSFKKDNINIDN
ncbi:MAG: hypothetical protein K0S34_856 [Bacillales bacterium]|jgi:membrane protein DedA with SNARE-associated domain|nr:hypothetical protein [Bacillales bacterium]